MADSEKTATQEAESPTTTGRLLRAAYRLVKSGRSRRVTQVYVVITTYLPILLMTTDYFHWWAAPWPRSVDRALVGLMTALLLAAWLVLTILGIGWLNLQRRKKQWPTDASGRLTLVRVLFWPITCILTAEWGYADLTGKSPRLWGRAAVLYWIVYLSVQFVVMAARSSQEARAKRQSNSSDAAPAPSTVSRPSPQAAPRSLRARFWSLRFSIRRRWWDLIHPGYLRRLSPINRALFESAVRGITHNIEVFLKRGADPNLTLIYGMPLIALCAGLERTEAVRLLLEAGANVDAASPSTGMNALLKVSTDGNLLLARLLIEHNANIEPRTNIDSTPLILAARNGHTEIIRLLLEHGAQTEAVTRRGTTALIMAAYQGHVEAVKVLLSSGADKARKDKRGRTALDYARRRGHRAVAALLETV